jgi:HAD superfamily hydrolase (TIGR01509 family)
VISRFDAVIFDMDGTVVDSKLDFQAIRDTLKIPSEVGILEAIEKMPGKKKEQAETRLLNWEIDAACHARLKPGASETIQYLRQNGLKIGLLTRNASAVVDIILEKHESLCFDAVVSRDDCPKIKPDPAAVNFVCDLLEVHPERTLCVGDYHYDIVAANKAGAASVLVIDSVVPDYADQAGHVIRELHDLIDIVTMDMA